MTFRADTNRRQGIGSELFVASVPERPELGAIGDDRLAEVERQLAGHAVEFDTILVIGPFWGLATLAALIGWWLTESIRRPARTVTPDWHSLRVAVAGAKEHTEPPPPGSPEAADEKKRRENTRRFQCLVLEGCGQEVPFRSEMGLEAAGEALSGAHGWLLWHPLRKRRRDMLAELVGDDGWQLPGAVPILGDGDREVTRRRLHSPLPDARNNASSPTRQPMAEAVRPGGASCGPHSRGPTPQPPRARGPAG